MENRNSRKIRNTFLAVKIDPQGKYFCSTEKRSRIGYWKKQVCERKSRTGFCSYDLACPADDLVDKGAIDMTGNDL